MTVASVHSNSSLEVTEKDRPFVRLNMADNQDARASSNGNDFMSWDTYNLANRRPIKDHKPKFYKQLYYQPDDAGTDSPGRVFLSFLAAASRWALIIFGVLGLFWVPAILQFTLFKHGKIWGVSLLHWSIWLSVFWGSLWTGTIMARLLPFCVDNTIGRVVSLEGRTYVDFVPLLSRYISLFLWTLASWVSFQPLIVNNIDSNASSRSKTALGLITKLLFGLFLCSVVLLAEKILIQFIAKHFHEESYAGRIIEQKVAVETLIDLYTHTTNLPSPETFADTGTGNRPTFHSAFPSVKPTSSVLRSIARSILGSPLIFNDSAESEVLTALCSANETRLLARRIFDSFVRQGETALVPADIARCFSSEERTMNAFIIFDKDRNGDVTREEMEMDMIQNRCDRECHNEQLSLANSLKDLDSAVGRLDNIFMTMYTFIAVLIIAVVLDSQLSTLLIGTGTFILGLSWLIGGSLTEILTSIIFLFIKHPYDVGDRIVINSIPYTVQEIFLLSTILLDDKNTAIQAPHTYLATQYIANIRRSPSMSETFTFDVAFDTKLESLELLRDKMLGFVKAHSRDYLPSFDVVVLDIPGQAKITLSADIRYKSNWQHGTLRTQRRNRWICALKECLADIKIYGPSGAGAPPEHLPKMYTEVPWSEAQQMNKAAEHSDRKSATGLPSRMIANPSSSSVGKNNLLNKNAGIFDSSQGVFGETEDLAMSNPVLRLPPKSPV